MVQTVSTLIAAVGVLLGLLTIRAGQRQRLRQFEAMYVLRYWNLMDGLSLDASKGEGQGPPTRADEQVILAYIRLCEDECELRKAGWIGAATWRLWKEGMIAQLTRWPFSVVWAQEREREPGRYEHLRRMTPVSSDGGTAAAIEPSPSGWARVSAALSGRAGV